MRKKEESTGEGNARANYAISIFGKEFFLDITELFGGGILDATEVQNEKHCI